jgi:hypothetical protein
LGFNLGEKEGLERFFFFFFFFFFFISLCFLILSFVGAFLMQQKSTVAESELQVAILDLVGPLSTLSKGEAAGLVELHESYLAGRERVSLPSLLQIVEWLSDFLEQQTFVEGIFRLSAPLAQLDALCILLMLRPELVSNEVLLRASAVSESDSMCFFFIHDLIVVQRWLVFSNVFSASVLHLFFLRTIPRIP